MKQRGELTTGGTYDGQAICPGESAAFGAKFKGEKHPTAGNLRRLFMKHGKDYWTLDRNYTFHPPCMRCGTDMGCFRCSGLTEELLCMKCKDWAHPDALEKHGPMIRDHAVKKQAIQILRNFTSHVRPIG